MGVHCAAVYLAFDDKRPFGVKERNDQWQINEEISNEEDVRSKTGSRGGVSETESERRLLQNVKQTVTSFEIVAK